MRSPALLAALVVAAPASAQTGEPWQPPTLTNTRYQEDWSRLADPANHDGRWTEPLKYVPLGSDAWVSTGIELRARVESFDDNLWGGADAPDDAYLWLRALPYADLHIGNVRAFIQPVVAYAVGVAPAAGPVDRTGVDILQGFAEVDLGAVTLRAGRQMLSLGTERLVGTRYGPNVPLAFDGVRADMTLGKAQLSLLAVRPVQPGPGSFDDATSDRKALWGAYVALPELDLYYLGYRNRAARFGELEGREVRHSVGVRSYGTRGAWRWNVEGVAQFGHYAGQRIAAWTIGTEIGRRLPALPLTPQIIMRANVVSGDRKANGTLGTFNALFPKGKYFGELSPIGPTNIINLHPGVALTLRDDLSLSIAGMAYWRYTKGDGIYDIPGNLIRGPGNATSRFIGTQVEAALSWQATPEWELSTSLSAFSPGAFLRQTGPAETIKMFGLESNFRF
ncbi:alginate export family protein [Sphingomonas bisphenolicum]